MSKDKKRLVPVRRFKEFENAPAWEQRKLGEVFSILKNNTLSRANLSDEHGAAQDIHYGDILTKFNEVLDISTTAVPYIQNEEVIEKTKATLLKNGDIVLADTAEDETAGKCTEIVGLVNQKVFAGLHTIPLRPNQSFSKEFLGFYMNSIAFRDQLKSLMQGIKVLSISKKALKETVISFPHDLREQEKIGQHLSNIDTLIALHQRKLDKLKRVKSAYLTEMFPAEGEREPKRRFPGFTGAWEQRKLGEVFSILKNNTLSRANLSDEHGAAQDIHYGDILTKFNEVLDISTTAVPYIQNEEVIEKTKATLLKNGDIVLADTAEDETAGKCTEIVGLVNQKVFAGLHTIPLRPNQSFSKEFLGFYMNSIAFRDQLKSLMQGIKVLSISKKALKETVISFPHDLREQEKIGQHLSNIDTLIALHQRKPNSLSF